jgi:hypothetical protein
MSPLTTYRKIAPMAQTTIAAKIHQSLDVHGYFTAKVAFHHVALIDSLANTDDLLFGQLIHTTAFFNANRPTDLDRLMVTNSMDVG